MGREAMARWSACFLVVQGGRGSSRAFYYWYLLNSFLSFPVALTQNKFKIAGSPRKFGLDVFYQLTKKSNPGRLGEKQECYLSAMPSTPLFYIKLVGKKDPGNYGT